MAVIGVRKKRLRQIANIWIFWVICINKQAAPIPNVFVKTPKNTRIDLFLMYPLNKNWYCSSVFRLSDKQNVVLVVYVIKTTHLYPLRLAKYERMIPWSKYAEYMCI
ncbi:hypothetical protein RF11_10290 [Thelohanellus kitauei]|uniref:Uncharacterized protein n=1 Tax=Thelohanellus kitauei TaxID=669202 RepID=A0A0C2N182_THEKT|nr:hypothetical protein RF11_10290 [Thelohanellus kitauei]